MERFAILLIGILGFVSCNPPEKSEGNKNIVIAHKTQLPSELHPTNSNSPEKIDVFQHVHAYLLKQDIVSHELVPELLTDVPSFNETEKTYSCQLVKNAKFDDGSTVSAQDVLFTYKVNACKWVLNGSRKDNLENIDDLIVNGDYAFDIKISERNIQDIYLLTDFPILQKSFYDSLGVLDGFTFSDLKETEDSLANPKLVKWAEMFNGAKYSTEVQSISGAGAYKVRIWDAQQLILVKKEGHWLEGSSAWVHSNYADEIVYKLNTDYTSRVLELKNKLVGVSTGFSSKEIRALREDTSITNYYNIRMEPVYGHTLMAFNLKPEESLRKSILLQKEVRQAIAYALPIDMAMDKLSNGVAIRIASFISPTKPEYNSDLTPYPYNLDKAKELMKTAGWLDSDKDGILDKEINGEKVDFELTIVFPDNSLFNAVVSLLSQGLEELGASVVFENSSDWHKKLGETKEFDLAFFSVPNYPGPIYPLSLVNSESYFNNGNNYAGYSNTQVDSIIDEISSSFNQEERKEQLYKLQEIVHDELPYVYISNGRRGIVVNKKYDDAKTSGVLPMIMLNTLKTKTQN